jgi:hypothetical protein
MPRLKSSGPHVRVGSSGTALPVTLQQLRSESMTSSSCTLLVFNTLHLCAIVRLHRYCATKLNFFPHASFPKLNFFPQLLSPFPSPVLANLCTHARSDSADLSLQNLRAVRGVQSLEPSHVSSTWQTPLPCNKPQPLWQRKFSINQYNCSCGIPLVQFPDG